MVDATAWKPKFRLNGKRSVKQHQKMVRNAKPKRKQTLRMRAVAEGIAPKACRPFALFMKSCCEVQKGASKSEHIEEMKRLGRAWKQLPPAEKDEYRRKCQDLFREQRSSLRSHGVPLRGSLAAEESASKDEAVEDAERPQLEKETSTIGKFQCWQEEGSDGSCVYVGEGSYGCVLLSQDDVGRKVVIKVFKNSCREDDLQYEVSVLRRLQHDLPLSCQCWFPDLLFVEERRVPFPHSIGLCRP